MIASFPNFTPLSLEHQPVLVDWFRLHPPSASEYTFSNLFGWRNAAGYELASFADGWLIRKSQQGGFAFLQPLVSSAPGEAVLACFDNLRAHGHAPRIERVEAAFAARLGSDPAWRISEDRDQFDYLYAGDDLRDLPGERFHDKKNLVAQFHRKYRARFLPMSAEIARACIEFAHEWCEDRRCRQFPGLREENCAVIQMLTHFSALGLLGGVLEIDGKLVACTLAEMLNPQTLVIHAEKAKVGLTGVYQVINQTFLQQCAPEVRYINREQDLGVEGLRKAKLSYNPVELVKKYRVDAVAYS